MNEKLERMRELIRILTEASKAYYQDDTEIMSNFEYDRLYDELTALEEETGTVLSTSPTVHVGYEAVDELPKERHEQPMLSLDKTKDVEALAAFAGTHDTLLSWKLDGLTVVLTYREGELSKAVTRGNGEIGEVITPNAKVFCNLPHRIPWKGELILRGEAVILYSDFEKINEKIEDIQAKYKNPRNLCSGSVRQLNSEVTAGRNVRFYAFSLVKADGVDFGDSRMRQFEWLKEQGFEVVDFEKVTGEGMAAAVARFAEKIADFDVPSDGLVAVYDSISYGRSLGRTAKFPRDSIAFKWKDEIAETTLLEVEWSPSRTGLINPVAIFEPVELEGTTVSRASVHNVSIVRGLQLGIGDRITVYKANMIIPQIADNLTRSGSLLIPDVCPACGMPTAVQVVSEAETLVCTNAACSAKQIKSYALFVSRDAMNIDGLSEQTLEKLIAHGFIRTFADLYHLDRHRSEIVQMDGFGEKSCANLLQSIENSRKTTPARLLYALGIPGIGTANARVLARHFKGDLDKIREASAEELSGIDGIGEIMAGAIVRYFGSDSSRQVLEQLLPELELDQEVPETQTLQIFEGKTFVVTGSVEQFANRNALKAYIEERGGKVTGSVTSKTDYLINNDLNSNSSKNRKARELGIPVISENTILNWQEE